MNSTAEEQKAKILLIDDDRCVLRALERLFEDGDFTVYSAGSGAEGLEIVKGAEMAVVVSDQGMPGMKGVEFLERIKEMCPDTVRIILTGYADLDAAIDATNKSGVYRYVAKPWGNDSLVQLVRTAVEQYGLVKANRYLTELTTRQNEELKQWSAELEMYIREQTTELTCKNERLVETNKQLKKSFRNFTVIMSNLLELRNRSMGSHSNNVAVLSRAIAQELGLSPEDVEHIALAAQLHDIGKIGIKDAALSKEIDRLTLAEMIEYKKHPIRGQAVIVANDALTEAADFIRSHHELWNGEGFPDRLAGEEIPLGARIVAIADRYDRLLTTCDFETALEKMRSLKGKEFDPDLYYILEKTARLQRTRNIRPKDQSGQRELRPEELAPGMVVSREVRSGTGVVLFRKGTTLDALRIESVNRFFAADPPQPATVSVWASPEGPRTAATCAILHKRDSRLILENAM
jgi:response regulator RpfG family c-di-GMP phosphodiesterase